MNTKHKLTKTMIRNAISGTCGNRNALAKRLGVDWHTIDRALARYPELEVEIQKERMQLVSIAEVKALELMKKGDSSMVKFILSTLGKNMGYSTDPDRTGTESNESVDTINIVDSIKEEE